MAPDPNLRALTDVTRGAKRQFSESKFFFENSDPNEYLQ